MQCGNAGRSNGKHALQLDRLAPDTNQSQAQLYNTKLTLQYFLALRSRLQNTTELNGQVKPFSTFTDTHKPTKTTVHRAILAGTDCFSCRVANMRPLTSTIVNNIECINKMRQILPHLQCNTNT
jgi:hypothetical protein